MTIAGYKEVVEARITKWFEEEGKIAPAAESRLLLDRMCALIKRGGKRARPELLYMTYAAYGGKNPACLVDLGLALELHHQFLLVHDDIIDKDTVRYDGPNIVGYYLRDNATAVSVAMGLLAGDLLFSFSNQAIISSTYFNDKQKVALTKLLNKATRDVAYGQQLDAFNLDTASTTLTEDLLLIHSNSSAFNNRPKYRDLRQGKITYPLYTALNLASKKQREYIKQSLGDKDLAPAAINKVVDILEDCGAKKASRDYLDQFFDQAFRALDELAISPNHKQLFTGVVEKYRI
jgi:geranylgeranyl pyrophosphate synthase